MSLSEHKSIQAVLRGLLGEIWHVIDHLGYTQYDLAEASGLCRSTICRTRIGVGIDHKFSTVIALAEAVGMEVCVYERMAKQQRRRA